MQRLPLWKNQTRHSTMKTLITTFLCALVMSFTALAPIELQAAACAAAEKVVVPETLVFSSPEFDTYSCLFFTEVVRAPPAPPKTLTSTETTFSHADLTVCAGGAPARCAWWKTVGYETYYMLC